MWANRYFVFWAVTALTVGLLVLAATHGLSWGWALIPLVLTVIGIHDMVQRRHAVLRNYPLIGHFRFIFESIRPELRQYFFEDEMDGRPFSRK